MFSKICQYISAITAASSTPATPITDQMMLDQLRFANPSDSFLQLHCDRMQDVVNEKAASQRVVLAV